MLYGQNNLAGKGNMTRFLFVVALTLLPLSVGAQEMQKVPFPTTPMELVRLPAVGVEKELDAARCGGDYFLWEENPNQKPVGLRVFMVARSGHDVHMMGFLKPRYRTVLDESRSTPTVEYLLPEKGAVAEYTPNGATPKIHVENVVLVLKMTRAEYNKAKKCLPTPIR